MGSGGVAKSHALSTTSTSWPNDRPSYACISVSNAPTTSKLTLSSSQMERSLESRMPRPAWIASSSLCWPMSGVLAHSICLCHSCEPMTWLNSTNHLWSLEWLATLSSTIRCFLDWRASIHRTGQNTTTPSFADSSETCRLSNERQTKQTSQTTI